MIDALLKGEIARDFVSRAPKHPVRLAEFASTGLPAPADWRGCMVYVPDKTCMAVSTGAAWLRADGSAL